MDIPIRSTEENYTKEGNKLSKLRRFEDTIAKDNLADEHKPDHVSDQENRSVALEALHKQQLDLAFSNTQEADRCYQIGLRLSISGKPAEAIKAYDRAIESKADNVEAYYVKGCALQELERYQEAIESFNQAIERKAEHAESYNGKGVALQKLERYQEAIESFNQAIIHKSDYATAYYNKGVILIELTQFESAVEAFDLAIQYRPNFADAYLNKGTALGELKKIKSAIEAFNLAIHYHREDVIKPYTIAIKYQPDIEGSYDKNCELDLSGDN